jgi:hypothetical protein
MEACAVGAVRPATSQRKRNAGGWVDHGAIVTPSNGRSSALLFIVFAQHCEELEFGRLRKKFFVPFEPGLLIREFQVNIQVLASGPILIKIKYVGIVSANVKMIVDTSRFGRERSTKLLKRSTSSFRFSGFFFRSQRPGGRTCDRCEREGRQSVCDRICLTELHQKLHQGWL